MPDMAGVGSVPKANMQERVDAAYAAVGAVLGREVPRHPMQVATARERTQAHVFRALVAAVALGEQGAQVMRISFLTGPASCIGVPTRTLYGSVHKMSDLLKAWPEVAELATRVLQILRDSNITVELPEPWREAVGFAWLAVTRRYRGARYKNPRPRRSDIGPLFSCRA